MWKIKFMVGASKKSDFLRAAAVFDMGFDIEKRSKDNFFTLWIVFSLQYVEKY